MLIPILKNLGSQNPKLPNQVVNKLIQDFAFNVVWIIMYNFRVSFRILQSETFKYWDYLTLFRFGIFELLIVAGLDLLVKTGVLMNFLVLSETFRQQTTEYIKVGRNFYFQVGL